MRVLVDIDEKQVRELDQLAKEEKQSRASLIREAVADYIDKWRRQKRDDAHGLWRDRSIDGLKYQEKIRGEW